MGKGDKSTKRGKIFAGSYGNSRPHDSAKPAAGGGSAAAAAKPAAKTARTAASRPATKAAPRKKA